MSPFFDANYKYLAKRNMLKNKLKHYVDLSKNEYSLTIMCRAI